MMALLKQPTLACMMAIFLSFTFLEEVNARPQNYELDMNKPPSHLVRKSSTKIHCPYWAQSPPFFPLFKFADLRKYFFRT